MAVLMLGLIPIVYTHDQDWNDGFIDLQPSDGKAIGMGAGDDDGTYPNNGCNDSQGD
ncbi:MAG: hypothetical protein WA667_25140 [Candidatus Nitrosopolaris sp.]